MDITLKEPACKSAPASDSTQQIDFWGKYAVNHLADAARLL
jgi:hypothetical protein